MAVITTSIQDEGGDYSSITAWEADLDNAGVYSASDDAVGSIDDNFLFAENPVINGGGTIGLATIKLTVGSGVRHDGTEGSGARLEGDIGVSVTDVTIEWLEIFSAGSSYYCIRAAHASVSNRTLVDKCILHGIDYSGSQSQIYALGDNSGAIEARNCIIYDIVHNGTGTRHVSGIYGASASRQIHIYNCTIHDIVCNTTSGNAYGFSFTDSTAHIVKNCVVTDPSGSTSGTKQCYSLSAPSNAVMEYNLASDTSASGTGSLDSKTSANQFVNTGAGTEDLHLKTGADAINAGTDLSGTFTDDIDADTRGAVWDMGADDTLTAAGGGALLPMLANYGQDRGGTL